MSKKLKTYIVICVLILLYGVLFGCKGKGKATTDIWKRDSTNDWLKTKWTDATKATRGTSGDIMWMDSTKGRVSFLEVTDTTWKGYFKERTKPRNRYAPEIGELIDTIPKKDTSRWQTCCGDMPNIPIGTLDNFPIQLIPNKNITQLNYNVNYNDSLQKIIDSLQIEIKKAKYIINLIDSIQKQNK